MSLLLMSLLGGGGRGLKQIKPMSLYILFFMPSLSSGVYTMSELDASNDTARSEILSSNIENGPFL